MTCAVLVLGGGPDREREVSLQSASAIVNALASDGYQVHSETIDTLTPEQLASMPGDVIFPALHGPWGEGGPMQDLLEASGRAYVGCGASAARLAMDKLASKLAATQVGAPTELATLLKQDDPICPIALPVAVKPVHDGSSVGLHICQSDDDWRRAHAAVVESGRAYMAERLIGTDGARREVAIGVVDGEALPIVEIAPAEGVYDFQAKYERQDTRYLVNPELPRDAAERVREWSVALARSIGADSLCRVDFMLDDTGLPWFLELNTMPGFTSSSLLPMAGKAAGMPLSKLCGRLIESAMNRWASAHEGGGW